MEITLYVYVQIHRSTKPVKPVLKDQNSTSQKLSHQKKLNAGIKRQRSSKEKLNIGIREHRSRARWVI
jgi:hypothetical protein